MAAVEASGRSPSPLPTVGAASAASPDLVRVLHQRRTQLVERETALQRWAVALELEAARQATAAKQLQRQEERASALAQESRDNRAAAQDMLADVQRREAALQRDAAELQQAAAAAQHERQELAAERASLEAASASLTARTSDLERREQQLAVTEEQWGTKVEAADAQLKVRRRCVCLPGCLHAAAPAWPAQLECAPPSLRAGRHRGGGQGSEGAALPGGEGSQALRTGRFGGRAQS